ncbi:DUF1942 domain-containing protein [Hamadaea tsunoensis]|uniref:DUF1942 domain-containing protein n=1 Tax=Hamadaea tsunoensis TaxID=53368 RepID=UPI0004225E9D|nr:DUF1942 domain-containing protein [Hamadaea tsunoensis]
MKRTAALIVLALTVLGCGLKPQRSTVGDGPSAPPSAGPTTNATARIGQSITLTGGLGDDEIAVTVSSARVYSSAPQAAWVKPQRGAYLAIQAEIRVVHGKAYACTCDFAAVGADGSLFEPVWPVGFGGGMQSVTLNSGEKTAGLVVFDLTADAAKTASIELRPDWTNHVRGVWRRS